MDEEAREVSIRVIERVSRVEKCVSGVSSERAYATYVYR